MSASRQYRLLFAISVLIGSATASDCPEQVSEFSADYDVERNGKNLGRAHFELEQVADGFRFSSRVEAERGLAGGLGASIEESSHFRQTREGDLQPLSYRYERSIAFSTRTEWAEFDWDAASARGEVRDESWQMSIAPGFVDRQTLQLQLARLACHFPNTDLRLAVARRGRLEGELYRFDGEEMLNLGSGQPSIRAIRYVDHDDDRRTAIWLAPSLNWLAARVQHVEDDEIFDMRLQRNSLRWAAE